MYLAVILVGTLLAAGYTLLMALFVKGWNATRTRGVADTQPVNFVSVVIAVRNEQDNILSLLNDLSAQNYPQDLYEVIISDDFSTDKTSELVASFISEKNNFHLITSQPGHSAGKKAALERAIKKAKGNIVATTDADCNMGKNWLRVLAQPLAVGDAMFVTGPVSVEDNTNRLFSKMQTLEFMSLTGATGGAAGIKRPVMCNGANMAFSKEAREQAIPRLQGTNLASGDDVFLMHAMKKSHPHKIHFVKNKAALVVTPPARTLGDFFSQRMRWAGKSARYDDGFTLLTGALVAGMNIFLVLLGILTIVVPAFATTLLGIFIVKLIIDGIVIMPVASFLSRERLLLIYPPMAIIYPFYVVITLVLTWVGKNHWKKRTIK